MNQQQYWFACHASLIFLILFFVFATVSSSTPEEDTFHGEASHSTMVKATTIYTILLIFNKLFNDCSTTTKGRVPGSKTIRRRRANLHDIFNEYGPLFFRRAYRMKEESFWKLLDLLEPTMTRIQRRKKRDHGRSVNGKVSSAMRLAIALRYFAGGDPLDIAAVYKVNRGLVYKSVWLVVEAINQTRHFDIKFPDTYEEQRKIANEFRLISYVGFNNCAGCVDGILIWITKPTIKDLEEVKIGSKKFFCGRKKKFGLNMQATCGSRRRFLDIDIQHPGATSDYLAFALSGLHRKLDSKGQASPFLDPALALYGDNAYVNTPWMVTGVII
jgi:DDE superfamily endonuclease